MKHVFITGCGRSGTTMLGSMLGACRDSVATPEADFFLDYYFQKGGKNTGKEDFIRFLNAHYRFRQWEVPASEIPFEPSDFAPYDLEKAVVKSTQAYASRHRGISVSDFTRIDHTPSNIKYFEKIDLSFPQARYIFMVRDPRAVFASVRDLDWGPNTALALSREWMHYAALYFAVQKTIPNRILLVRYEDLVREPAEELTRICDFCKLEYRPEIRNGGGLRLPQYTVRQHTQVGKAPNPDNIDKWKKQLTEKDLLILEAACGLVMNAFGYTREKPLTYRVGLRDRIRSAFRESYLYLLHKIRKRRREKSV